MVFCSRHVSGFFLSQLDPRGRVSCQCCGRVLGIVIVDQECSFVFSIESMDFVKSVESMEYVDSVGLNLFHVQRETSGKNSDVTCRSRLSIFFPGLVGSPSSP